MDDRFNSVSESDIEVTVDGKKLEVNRYSEYGEIDLIGWNDARIDNIQYIQEKVNAKRADIKTRVEVTADKEGEATLMIKVDGLKNTWLKTVPVKKGKNLIETDLVINNPKLWWTNGLGEAHLYPFTATITMNGKIADTETTHIASAASASFATKMKRERRSISN